jgi:hypothetical protein
MERGYILRVFREAGGVISIAADRLGVPRTTLHGMLKNVGDFARRPLIILGWVHGKSEMAHVFTNAAAGLLGH